MIEYLVITSLGRTIIYSSSLLDAIQTIKKYGGELFQKIKVQDYSRFIFVFNDDSVITDEEYTRFGYSKEEIEANKEHEEPSFYIKNLDEPDNDRDCPLGWPNTQEYCYAIPEA